MAVKFSQFTTGATLADIDYFVGYKGTDNIQIAKSLLSGTTYTIDVPAATTNINLAGSDGSNDAITLTAGTDISLTRISDSEISIASTATGDTYTLQAGTKVGSSVPLQLDAAVGTDSTVNLTEGSGVTLTQTSATEITIDATAGANTIAIDTFTGNGSTAVYTLSNSASSENELQVYFDGVYQLHDSYTVSGTTLTFDTNVPNGTAIEVYHLVSVNLSNVVQSLTGGDGITASASTGDVTLSLSSSTPNAFTIGGDGSTGGVTVDDGSIQIRSNTGNVAEMRMYCEVSNAHFQTIKAAPHSEASSAVLTLPVNTGNLVGTGDTDSVTHTMLENRYTALSALGTGSTFALDFSTATTFTATANANATFNFSNAVQGQVIDLILTGNYTITFSETGSTFNKVGTTDYDGTANNLIQIVCTDDSSGSKIYLYSVGTYTSDPTP